MISFMYRILQEMLATNDELKGFTGHATKTAALDYIISVESDVFVPSHSGNMARAVEGHRRFLGHRRTITPDRFYVLLLLPSNFKKLLSFTHFVLAHEKFGVICRKGLVKLFNKVERGQLKEGTKLSNLVKQMHQDR